jgi:hypothetical protein
MGGGHISVKIAEINMPNLLDKRGDIGLTTSIQFALQ